MERMARVVMLWTRPYHLSGEEAAEWARKEASRLLTVDGVAGAELTRLQSVSDRLPRAWDWMLEVHLAAGADPAQYIAAPPCAEWLADLRALGLRPSVLLADGGVPLGTLAR